VREYHREKCACRACQQEITTAPAPSRPIEKGIAGPGLLAQVVVDKFADHLPAYRQEKRFKREGINLSRQTICGWYAQINDYTQRVVEVMRQELLGGDYLQADDTPVPVQDRDKPGRHHQGYLWLYGRPGGPVVYDFQMTRQAREGPVTFLKGFRGFLQHDGYPGFGLVECVTHVACMAHIRRKFWHAMKAGEREAGRIVQKIGWLYRLERKMEARTPEERNAYRERHAKGWLECLKKRIESMMAKAPPASGRGVACRYALEQWPNLLNYLKDGRIRLDNNLCENAVRPVTLGRKNWLHIGSEEAGPVAANFMSLVETCKRFGVNPQEYFTDLFTRIADHPVTRIAELTPYAWAQARSSAAQAT
jgi:hypothetical protein